MLEWQGALGDVLTAEQLRDPHARRVAAETLAQASFLVVDLETTGVGPGQSDILEIGAVRVQGLRVRDTFTTFVRPPGPVPPFITRLTGIDDAAVVDAPSLREALDEYRAFAAQSPTACFVAHNASFDSGFMEAGLARCGLPGLGMPVLCTRLLGRRLVPEVGRYGLDALSAHFGISNRARHRALGDARATGHLLLELLGRARDSGIRQVGGLMDLQARPPAKKQKKKRARRSRAKPAARPRARPRPDPTRS